jgi:maltose-binding protein MalE
MRSGVAAILTVLILFVAPLAGCLASSTDSSADDLADDALSGDDPGVIELVVWASFALESKEEEAFLDAVKSFEVANPSITVEATLIPYTNADQLYMTAAQGGEAPDLVRLSSDQLGKIGAVRVNGYPLLEDLRPHLTPTERTIYDTRALQAMRYGDDLLGLPASQDCLSLIWNKRLFDQQGIEYPDENWTLDDLVVTAENLTNGDVQGLAIPVKNAYWWFPFQTAFGGQLFDENGTPSLDSNGSADAMQWMIGLEKENGVVAKGTQIESMKTQFMASKAAIIVDGPWNWATYEASRLDIGQTLLPSHPITGLPASPLVTYKGWSVSESSAEKEAAVELALWLSSPEVQRVFALQTYTMPTAVALYADSNISDDPVLSGFLAQAQVATPAPTTRGMSLVYGPLGTAFERTYADPAIAETALKEANDELISLIAGDI